MHKFSVGKDMNFFLTMIKREKGGSREGGNAFMSHTNYQIIEN
jgi:hypothetical protein